MRVWMYSRPFLQVFPKASSEAGDLLRKLLHFNPYKRMTAEVVATKRYPSGFCILSDCLAAGVLGKIPV